MTEISRTDHPIDSSPPPVVERVIEFIYTPLADYVFSEKLETWKNVVTAFYPAVETLTHWSLQVPSKNGVPDFSSIQPQLQLRHRLWRQTIDGQKVWCMQCLPDRLVLNVVRESGNVHSYKELHAEAESWLPRWCQHFEVDHFKGVSLQYVNRLDEKLTPQFIEQQGDTISIAVGKVFRLFADIPMAGTKYGIVPPYDCTVNLEMVEPFSGILSVNVKGKEDGPHRLDISLRFCAMNKKGFDQAAAFVKLTEAHEMLQKAFRSLFTENAIKSFNLS